MPIDLRISLRKLEVLTLVVDLGGVSRAAEHLFVAQPVVTAHIRSLEGRLGAKLFYRDGRQMQLTDAGRAVYLWAQDVLRHTGELDRHLRGLQDGSKGTVVIGASMSIGSYRLPTVLTSFRRSHPDVDLRLGISDTEHAIEDTRSGAFDFAVVVSDALLDVPGMNVERIGEDEIIIVASPDGPPADDVIDMEEFQRLPFIDAPEGIVRRTFVDRQLRRHGIADRNVVLQLGHPEAMKRASRDGVGATLLFRSAVEDELRAGVLREIKMEGVEIVVPVYLVSRKEKSFSPVHQRLIEAIRVAMTSPAAATATAIATATT